MSNLLQIPAELRECACWVVWKSETRAGSPKPTKVPYQARNGEKASTTNPTTWCTFEKALTALERSKGRYTGVGFVFAKEDPEKNIGPKHANPFAGIDLDHCRNPDTGEIEDWAQEIIAEFNSYTEVSPSKTGVKIFIQGQLPPDCWSGHKKGGLGLSGRGAIEVYDRERYFTVTGWHLAGHSTLGG